MQWFLPDIVCKIFLAADVFASTASIVHLMGISVDRFFAVVYHMKYRTVQHAQIIFFAIGGIWIFSVGLSLPIALGLNRGFDPLGNYHCGIDSPAFMLYGSIFAFYIPCLIMVTMYGFVFYQLRRRLQAVKLQELAAGKFVTFGHNLDNMLATAYGGRENARRNTALMWTIPFLQNLEESIIDDDQSVSSQDWDELTTILCQIETSNAATYGSSSSTVLPSISCPGHYFSVFDSKNDKKVF